MTPISSQKQQQKPTQKLHTTQNTVSTQIGDQSKSFKFVADLNLTGNFLWRFITLLDFTHTHVTNNQRETKHFKYDQIN